MNTSNISVTVDDAIGHVSTNYSYIEDSLGHKSSQTIFYSVNIAINCLLSLPCNGYVLWLIVSGAGGTLALEFFTLNLAVSEILYCLLCMLFYINLLNPLAIFNTLLIFSSVFMNASRPMFQCCTCLERYLAVVHPVVFLKYKPLRYRMACCGVVWLLVIGLCFTIFLADLSKNDNYYIILYVMVMSVMLFCCLSVLRALKRPGPGEGERKGGVASGRGGSRDMKMRAFKFILIITAALMINYFPVLFLFFFNMVITLPLFRPISMIFMVVGGLVQPFLYIHRAGRLPCLTGL
ncbi:P2Y purinoceptor 8-like [Osmerus mordax]|uniref:P2Y purinoceptor 8-like n=1 Tax=Osmerus mordax TaxID=8014 RepID=UPI00350FB504